MPQVVAPWTWRRMLRDHGPDDAGFLLAMFVLTTWLNNDGFAYPGQPLWARGARKSVRMLQRYIARARREGWLSVVNAGRGGKGWAFNGYRCCIPDSIKLDDKDEAISTALQAQNGTIDADDISVSSPRVNGHDTKMSSPTTTKSHGDDTARTMVTTSRALGDDTTGNLVATSGSRTNSRSENSHFNNSQEKAALARSALGKSVRKPATPEEIQERRQQAAELVKRAEAAASK